MLADAVHRQARPAIRRRAAEPPNPGTRIRHVSDGFGLGNLPYGAVARPGEPAQLAVRFGNEAVPLEGFEDAAELPPGTLAGPVLNPLLALGRPAWSALRGAVREAIEAGRAWTVPLESLAVRLP